MSALLEVIVYNARDAQAAEEGGADAVMVVGARTDGGMSPTPETFAEVRAATSLDTRPMVRLRAGYGTDGGEITRLHGLIHAYTDAGADGMALGFVNELGQVDVPVLHHLVDPGLWRWTFHRGFDACIDTAKAWRDVLTLPRLDRVLTAGSARTLTHGLDELVALASQNPDIAAVAEAAGEVLPEHVPWLVRAGITKVQVSDQVRIGGRDRGWVDATLVHSWRVLLNQEVRRNVRSRSER